MRTKADVRRLLELYGFTPYIRLSVESEIMRMR